MDQILDILSKMDFNRGLAILAVVGFGVFAMVKIFGHMKDGFGPFNRPLKKARALSALSN
ncbi:hypothetical protein [Azotobacter beijerinckii]|uniref:hypothetical protein n=1 Tax=Azotobacter beijerinckii TaxID=170623 RepID=UPI0011143A09|nr:hypothetical protein [Azotobacter beijerinckii]